MRAMTTWPLVVIARAAVVVVVVVVSVVVGMLVTPSARAQECTYIPEGASWLYQVEPGPVGWTDPDLPDDPAVTAWQAGCAPFSNTGCGFAPGTVWTTLTNLNLRNHAWLPAGATSLEARVAIDNDFDLYVNGTLVRTLVKEGCATRWDAVIPVPDALWRVGDNVVAARLIDRGGVTNFEMTLTAPDTGNCQPGCSALPCNAPGPAIVVPDAVGCSGEIVLVSATASWGYTCASGLVLRFLASDGTLLRDWDPSPFAGIPIRDAGTYRVEARCADSALCPSGQVSAAIAASPYPPADPGPTLRVRKTLGLARLDWSAALPLGTGEHDHVHASPAPDDGFMLVGGEGRTSRDWIDPEPFGRAHYLVRVADRCEMESLDAP